MSRVLKNDLYWEDGDISGLEEEMLMGNNGTAQKVTYDEAVQAKKEVSTFLRSHGIRDAGVGLTSKNGSIGVSVHLVEPLPSHVREEVEKASGTPVFFEVTGRAIAY